MRGGIFMPKQGFESITVPSEFYEKVSQFVDQSKGIISNKTQAILNAWQIYEKFFLEKKNPKPVKIGNKLIGNNLPVFVIAEIGINHNGDMKLCKKLIDMAVETGCDAVKFQKRTIDIVYTKEELEKPREHPFGTTNKDLKKRLEFEKEQYQEIDKYCKEKGMLWFASPWDLPSVNFLEQFDVPCYKIASPCLTDKDLLLKIKATGKPIILSTGMSKLEEIKKAVAILGEENLVIMHCTSTYPTKIHEINLNIIKEYQKYFNCPIGYSGHEPGIYPTLIAATLGANVIERHITLDRSMFGNDQAASLEKEGITRICQFVRYLPIYLGREIKIVHESEKAIMKKLRRVDNL